MFYRQWTLSLTSLLLIELTQLAHFRAIFGS